MRVKPRYAESNVYVIDLARPNQPRPLTIPGPERWPVGWSPDGRLIPYVEVARDTRYSLWVAPAAGGGSPTPVVRGPGKDQGARFSPDGRYIAYQSDESGVTQIYITNAAGNIRHTVIASTGEANHARWRGDGRELLLCDSRSRGDGSAEITESASGLGPGHAACLVQGGGAIRASGSRQWVLGAPRGGKPGVHPCTASSRGGRGIGVVVRRRRTRSVDAQQEADDILRKLPR